MTEKPFPATLISRAGIAQLVEHNLAKVGVAGSNPVSRSMMNRPKRPRGLFWRLPYFGTARIRSRDQSKGFGGTGRFPRAADIPREGRGSQPAPGGRPRGPAEAPWGERKREGARFEAVSRSMMNRPKRPRGLFWRLGQLATKGFETATSRRGSGERGGSKWWFGHHGVSTVPAV